jgi:hypothetical protein
MSKDFNDATWKYFFSDKGFHPSKKGWNLPSTILLYHQFFRLNSCFGLYFKQVNAFCHCAYIHLNQILALEFLLMQQCPIHIENANGGFSLQAGGG